MDSFWTASTGLDFFNGQFTEETHRDCYPKGHLRRSWPASCWHQSCAGLHLLVPSRESGNDPINNPLEFPSRGSPFRFIPLKVIPYRTSKIDIFIIRLERLKSQPLRDTAVLGQNTTRSPSRVRLPFFGGRVPLLQ